MSEKACIHCGKCLKTEAEQYGRFQSYTLCQSCYLRIDNDDQYTLDEFIQQGYTAEELNKIFFDDKKYNKLMTDKLNKDLLPI